MKRSGFKRKEIARTRQKLSAPKAWRSPQPVADRVLAAPKDEPYRDRRLLDLAEKQDCLLRIPGVCNFDRDTTVACHGTAVHGKGAGLKSHDAYSVWGCSSCHAWLDQGGATRNEKAHAFDIAHDRQVKAWADLRDAGGPGAAIAGAALDWLSDRRG